MSTFQICEARADDRTHRNRSRGCAVEEEESLFALTWISKSVGSTGIRCWKDDVECELQERPSDNTRDVLGHLPDNKSTRSAQRNCPGKTTCEVTKWTRVVSNQSGLRFPDVHSSDGHSVSLSQYNPHNLRQLAAKLHCFSTPQSGTPPAVGWNLQRSK